MKLWIMIMLIGFGTDSLKIVYVTTTAPVCPVVELLIGL